MVINPEYLETTWCKKCLNTLFEAYTPNINNASLEVENEKL